MLGMISGRWVAMALEIRVEISSAVMGGDDSVMRGGAAGDVGGWTHGGAMEGGTESPGECVK